MKKPREGCRSAVPFNVKRFQTLESGVQNIDNVCQDADSFSRNSQQNQETQTVPVIGLIFACLLSNSCALLEAQICCRGPFCNLGIGSVMGFRLSFVT